MPSQDMCPICCESFKSTEIIIEYQKWGNMKLLASSSRLCAGPFESRRSQASSSIEKGPVKS
jgi:hypothetical protein